jgi:hypothetical protein
VSSPAGKEIIYWLVETPTNNLRTPTGAKECSINFLYSSIQAIKDNCMKCHINYHTYLKTIALIFFVCSFTIGWAQQTKHQKPLTATDSLCLVLNKTKQILARHNYFKGATINKVLKKLPFKIGEVYFEERWARTPKTNVVTLAADDIYKERALGKGVFNPSMRIIYVIYNPGINIDTLSRLVFKSRLKMTDSVRAYINKHKIDHVELPFCDCK